MSTVYERKDGEEDKQVSPNKATEHYEHVDLEKTPSGASSFINRAAAKGEVTHNPLKDLSREGLIRNVSEFIEKHGFHEDRDVFIKGALLAQSGEADGLTEEEEENLTKESTHRWHQPKTLYYLSIMCAMCAVVQGMDETVINGAMIYYTERLGLDDITGEKGEWISGLVVGAPYLCCAVIGCALTDPLNNLIGRRGVIFLSCFIAAVASIWEAFTYSWVQLFLARLLLGLGIGPKSATVPVYAAECTPAPIRGALVMMWQMWTAFGIMFGYIMCVAFMPSGSIDKNTAWRLMLGSTVVAPAIVCLQVYFVPESPRWYIKKNRYQEAYSSLLRLRNTRLQAARDLYYMDVLIQINEKINEGHNAFIDLFKVPRNRRALQASQFCMFMQQFTGVNVIAYYSTNLFLQADYSEKQALLASMGFGMVNFFFALPAVFTIDTFGRRSLVLFCYPFLAFFLLLTGFAFYIPQKEARIGVIMFGIYMYTVFYSPGMGPVPFTYSAEVFPLHVRDLGMSLGTITLWGFNFILALTWPPLLARLKPQGAFGYYAAWNVVGFVVSFLIMPETKALTLEELDIVFSVPTSEFIKYQFEHIPYHCKKYILRKKNLPRARELYEWA
jgi:sugar porter (SP) family MFS transporter